jgi:hypothetical protein
MSDSLIKIKDGSTEVSNFPEVVKPNALKKLSQATYSIDASSTLIYDASVNLNVTAIIISNCGDEAIYLNFTTATATAFFKKLDAGESWEFPIGSSTDATNDIYCIRDSAQANDDVIVTIMGEN